MLVPIKRGGATGYESWSPELRERIVQVLKGYDAFEGKTVRPEGLIPDHKFPEIRWDDSTSRGRLEALTNLQISSDFQLLNNQRNLQKREVCRACYQSGRRGFPLGIKYFYKGNEDWPKDIPARGKAAEEGCVGCGWYDFEKWRIALSRKS